MIWTRNDRKIQTEPKAERQEAADRTEGGAAGNCGQNRIRIGRDTDRTEGGMTRRGAWDSGAGSIFFLISGRCNGNINCV